MHDHDTIQIAIVCCQIIMWHASTIYIIIAYRRCFTHALGIDLAHQHASSWKVTMSGPTCWFAAQVTYLLVAIWCCTVILLFESIYCRHCILLSQLNLFMPPSVKPLVGRHWWRVLLHMRPGLSGAVLWWLVGEMVERASLAPFLARAVSSYVTLYSVDRSFPQTYWRAATWSTTADSGRKALLCCFRDKVWDRWAIITCSLWHFFNTS